MRSADHSIFNADLAGGLATLRYGLALWSVDQRLVYFNKAFADLFEPLSPFSEELYLSEFLATLRIASEVAPDSNSEITPGASFEYVLSDGRTLEILIDADRTGVTAMTVQDITIEKRGERARASESKRNCRAGRQDQISFSTCGEP